MSPGKGVLRLITSCEPMLLLTRSCGRESHLPLRRRCVRKGVGPWVAWPADSRDETTLFCGSFGLWQSFDLYLIKVFTMAFFAAAGCSNPLTIVGVWREGKLSLIKTLGIILHKSCCRIQSCGESLPEKTSPSLCCSELQSVGRKNDP